MSTEHRAEVKREWGVGGIKNRWARAVTGMALALSLLVTGVVLLASGGPHSHNGFMLIIGGGAVMVFLGVLDFVLRKNFKR